MIIKTHFQSSKSRFIHKNYEKNHNIIHISIKMRLNMQFFAMIPLSNVRAIQQNQLFVGSVL